MASYAWHRSMPMVTMVQKPVRQPGIEPKSIAWKATMLTFAPQTLVTYTPNMSNKYLLGLAKLGHRGSLLPPKPSIIKIYTCTSFCQSLETTIRKMKKLKAVFIYFSFTIFDIEHWNRSNSFSNLFKCCT